MSSLAITERTRLHRRSNRGSHERAIIDSILDEALLCHVGFVAPEGWPVVIPTAHVRVADHLYLHGAPANRMLKTLAGGVDVSIAATLLDGLVLARSAFHHSMNYRSVVLFGRAVPVCESRDKRRVLDALLEKLLVGRSAEARPATEGELAATSVLAVPIEEASAKIRRGPPIDDEADLAGPFWAGEIPIELVRRPAVTAPDCTLPAPVSGTQARSSSRP